MEIKTAIITAAGFGSRFLPFVKNIPKEMLPIINKPSIQYLVEECIDAGIERVIIVVREGNTLIEDYFNKPAPEVEELLRAQGKESRFEPVKKILDYKGVVVINQDPSLPYGNGSPVYSAKHLLVPNEPFVIMFGDDMVIPDGDKGGLEQMIDFYEENKADTDLVIAGVKLTKEEVIGVYGTVKFKEYDEEKKSGVMDYQIEKPTLEEFEKHGLSTCMSYGRMVSNHKLFNYLKPDAIGKDGELWVQDAVAEVARNSKVMVKILDGRWLTTGDPERYFQAVTHYYLKHSKYGDQTRQFLSDLG